jgi:membrane-associated phospholipid phosphatase
MSRKVLVAAGLLAAGVYALLWLAVGADWRWLDVADSWVLRQFHDAAAHHPGWIGFWRAVSDVLSPTVLRIVAVVAVVAAVVRGKAREAMFLLLTLGAMGLVTVTAKALADRPRPDTALTVETSTAFPSGHALGMMVGALAFITVLWPRLSASMRRPAAVVAVTLIVLVGLARVALNVHHPSDVLAGWALGFLYYLMCLAVVRRPDPKASPDVTTQTWSRLTQRR